MGIYEPQTLVQLSTVIATICKALEEQEGAMPTAAKKAIALRVVELYECGISPDRLLLEVMADSLWASSNRQFSPPPGL
jgi:hypothetical protein